MPQLQRLALDNNALGESGGVAVGEALKSGKVPQLQRLVLDDNALGDGAAAALAAAISANALPNLAQLELEGDNNVSDAGRKALDDAKEAAGSEVEITF